MSEQYYRYQSDDAKVDLMDGQLYEYVLTQDRNDFYKLANTGPRCMQDFSDMQEVEHFANLNGSKKWVKHMLLLVVLVVVLYLLYCMCSCSDKTNNSDYSTNYDLYPQKYAFTRA